MCGYRMLFGVPDEITDVKRVSGMVPKRRLIYRMTSFGYRKVFVHYRKVSGSSVVYRECREGCRGPSGGVSRQPDHIPPRFYL